MVWGNLTVATYNAIFVRV